MTKVVGVKIDTKSPHTKDKIYYYKTEKDFKRCDVIDIVVETGGSPTATVAIANSKKKHNVPLKNLELDHN